MISTLQLTEHLGVFDGIWSSQFGADRHDAEQSDPDELQDGVVRFMNNNSTPTRVGRRDIDWSAKHHGHQEWRAQLNRFGYLAPLAAAYTKTKDRCYAEAARDYLEDWIQAHPSDDPWIMPAYDHSLNLSIRIGNSQWAGWLGVLPTFLDVPDVFDEPFVCQLIESVRVQLNVMVERLNPDGNMRISQADTLLGAAMRLPGLSESLRWRDMGVAILNEAAVRQFLSDGVHIERNPGYHAWMTRVMHCYWQLAQARPELGLTITTANVAAMYDYAMASVRPEGHFNALHDCFGPNSDPLPVSVAQERATFRAEAGLNDAMPDTSAFFPAAGQALLRDRWATDAMYITFDATTWGGSHCHLSRNAIQIDIAGRPMLVDPGTLSYEVSEPLMSYGKSTRAHNTINLNGYNQAPSSPSRTCHEHADGFDLVVSEYESGYWPGRYTWAFEDGIEGGLWATHNRTMLWVHKRCIIVIDSVHRAGTPNDALPFIECNWQFACGPLDVSSAGDQVVAKRDNANLLMLFAAKPDNTMLTVHEGERNPPRGWIGGDRGIIPAPQLCLIADPMAGDYAEFVTVLIPFTSQGTPEVIAEVSRPEPNLVTQLILRWPDGRMDRTRWTHRAQCALGGEDGAAAVVHDVLDKSDHVQTSFAAGCGQ